MSALGALWQRHWLLLLPMAITLVLAGVLLLATGGLSHILPGSYAPF
ncbi:MAG: hypothetical protein ACI8S6_002831 [Myxococcota bacterium]